MPRTDTRPRRPLRVERLEDRLTPVAVIYAGVPLTAAIPAHTREPLPATFSYVSPDGLNPDGPTTGAEGTLANPRTYNGAISWANGLAAGVVPTLSFRRGLYPGASNALDRPMVLQAYPGEEPWLDGAVPVTNWTADTATVPGRTVWAMGTSSFDPDGAGPDTARNFEFPQYRDFHYVDVTKNPFANNGEAVFVQDGAAAPAPVKQVGLYRKMAAETYTINVGGTATVVSYLYRRSSDNKLLAPGGVPATDFAGKAIDGGGTTDADYQAAVSVVNNLSAATSTNAALDTLVDNSQGLAAEKFFVDYIGHKLYLAADPAAAGRAVRVTAVNVGVYANSAADDSVIRGLGFTRYARSGVAASSCERLRLEANAAVWNQNTGLVVNGADTVARGNVLVANGEGGMGGSGDRLLGENNIISYSNVERYATNWNAAGWKVTNSDDMVFRNNTFLNNFCTSLWMDINVRRAFVVNNYASNKDIGGGGLAYFSEISDVNTIAFNVAYRTGTGVLISGTSRNRIYNNTFVLCGQAIQFKDYDRTNDWNEDGGAVGGGGAYDLDPNEGGEDDKEAALGSTWDVYDNEVSNNLFADTSGSRLIDAAGTQDPYNSGDPLPNSRITGRPFDSRTMIAAMDFNGYHVTDTADDLILWDPGLGSDITYDTAAEFNTFRTTYGLEPHTLTSGAGQLVYIGGADPFLANVAGGDYRPRAGGPAVGRSVGAGTLAAVPADILAAAGRLQPTFLGALPPASSDTAPPTVTPIANQSVSENTTTAALAFTVGDAVTAASSLTVVATSSNLALVPLANTAVGGSGPNRTVTVTPAGRQIGTTTVTLTVSDAAGNRTVTTFQLKVAQNAAAFARPGFTSGGSTNRSSPSYGVKNTALAIPFALTDAGAGGSVNAVTLSATSWGEEFVPNLPANVAFSGTGANRTLTLTPLPGTTGILSLDVLATNAQGAAITRRIYVDFRETATGGNRSPRIHTILNRGLPVGTSTGKVEYTVNDLEQPTGAGLVVTAASSDPLLVPAANISLGGEGDSNPDSRWVQVTPASGRSGVAVVTLTVRDNGADGTPGTADDATGVRQFTVFVNSAPTGVGLSNTSVTEGQPAGTAVGTLSAADPGAAGDSFTFSLVGGTGSTDNALFQVVGNQLRAAGPLDFAAGATRSVRVRVTDFMGASFEQVFSVRVAQVVTATVAANGGAAQRSRLTTLAVTFNAAVTLQPGAFALTRQSDGAAVRDGGTNPQVAVTTATANGRTTATLSFLTVAGSPLVEAGSLADGVWVLRVDKTKVSAATGAMPADATTPASGAGRLHRLFGDGNGDGTVDGADFLDFVNGFGLAAGDAGFAPGYDGTADGLVDGADFLELVNRFGVSL